LIFFRYKETGGGACKRANLQIGRNKKVFCYHQTKVEYFSILQLGT